MAHENTKMLVFLSANTDKKYDRGYENSRIFIGPKTLKYCQLGGYFAIFTPHFRPVANHILPNLQCMKKFVFQLLCVNVVTVYERQYERF